MAVGLVMTAAVAALAGQAQAAPLQATQRITGPAATPYQYGGAELGDAVAPLGDVNGDGLPDILLSRRASRTGGSVWVVLGSRTPSNLTLPSGDQRSFRITGTEDSLSASPGGDIDGDGYRDILVRDVTRGYIVYGGPGVRDINVNAPADPRVTTLTTSIGLTDSGFVSAGDFNGDGKADIYVQRDTDAAVILGGPRTATFDTTTTGARIVRISGIKRCSWRYLIDYQCFTATNTLVPVGDINGDGKADLFQPEKSFVTLGRIGNATIASAAPDAHSIVIKGLSQNAVPTVPGPDVLGDVTGDGITDIAFPRLTATSATRIQIIPGRRIASGTIDVATEPSISLTDGDRAYEVRAAGDVNGDGRADVLVSDADGVRVVSLPATVPSTIAVSGASIPGLPIAELPAYPDPFLPGTEVAQGVGDIDGDGQSDVAVGFPTLPYDGEPSRGRVYLVTHGPVAAGGVGTPTPTPGPSPTPTPAPTPTPTPTPTPDSGLAGWVATGSAGPAEGGGAGLTQAAATQSGAFYDTRRTIDGHNFTAEFDVAMTGGTRPIAGNGVTFALASAAQGGSARAFNAGIGLGWVGNKGIAITLGTVKGGGTLSNNYVGVATGTVGKSGYPTFLASQQAVTPLQGNTTHVKIHAGGGLLTVELAGVQRLSMAIPATMPSDAWAGFTGGTGLYYQQQVIKNAVVTPGP